MFFEELNLSDNILDALWDMHFDVCTPVQEACIPKILERHDIIGVAQTGTGKTAAYLLPVLSLLDEGQFPEDAINCVIMSPTRELAQQIDQAMQGFAYYLDGVSCVAVYGGNDGNRYDQELKSLSLGADVVIATPGRFISHISLGNVDLSKVSFFILDEADRMLDMGFHDDIMQIYKHLPKECQVVMFSATMPPKIRTLAHNILKDPEEIKIAVSRPPESIMQTAYICYEAHKMPLLKQLFAKKAPERVIIFSSSKMKVKELAATLKRMNYSVAAMHSDLEQSEREQVMKDFRNGHIGMLVATDVVARGIDINDISLVINYDIPNDPEDYVHRIGRTARGTEGSGLAITFVSQQEQARFKEIETFIEKDIYKIPIDPSIGESPTYEPEKYSRTRGKGGRGRQSGSGGGRAKAQSTSSKPRGGGNRRRNKPSQNRPAHS